MNIFIQKVLYVQVRSPDHNSISALQHIKAYRTWILHEAVRGGYAKTYFEHDYVKTLCPTTGPHFSEFLTLHVGDDCSVTLVCKVNTANHYWWVQDAALMHWSGPDWIELLTLSILHILLSTRGSWPVFISAINAFWIRCKKRKKICT